MSWFELMLLVLFNELVELLEVFLAPTGLLVMLNTWLGDFSLAARILPLDFDPTKLSLIEAGAVTLFVFNLMFSTFSLALIGFLTKGFSLPTSALPGLCFR